MIISQLTNAVEDLGGAFSIERIEYSLKMTALGLIAVFSVLAIIWAVLTLFRLFSTKPTTDGPSPKKAQEESVNPAPPVQKTEAVPVTVTNNDDATVAAIIAAISAYIASDDQLAQEYTGGFRVVSFKRVRDKASWNTKK